MSRDRERWSRISDLGLAELLAEVRRIEVQSKRLVTDVMAGGYSSVFRGSGIEFDEVREYVDGDDPARGRLERHRARSAGRTSRSTSRSAS